MREWVPVALSEQLAEDMKQAMKARDQFTLSVIRMLRSELQYAQIAAQEALSEDDIIDIISREQKKRKDALAECQAAGRTEAAEKLERELAIIASYLPQPLTEQALMSIIQQAVAETGAASKADLGRVMSQVMPRVRGRADGSLVSRLAKQHLSQL